MPRHILVHTFRVIVTTHDLSPIAMQMYIMSHTIAIIVYLSAARIRSRKYILRRLLMRSKKENCTERWQTKWDNSTEGVLG